MTAVLGLVALWVLLGALWFAVYPFLSKPGEEIDPEAIERSELEAEKARLLKEIHELELDYETGKLSDADFAELEGRLKGRAVEVMKALDGVEGAAQTGSEVRTTR